MRTEHDLLKGLQELLQKLNTASENMIIIKGKVNLLLTSLVKVRGNLALFLFLTTVWVREKQVNPKKENLIPLLKGKRENGNCS